MIIASRKGRLWIVAAALMLCVPAVTQPQSRDLSIAVRAEPPDWGRVEIKTTRVADDFYTLEAQGSSIPVGTVSVLTGPDGVLLVDSLFAPLSDKLVAAIRKLSDQPIRFVINTHVHADHTGGNASLSKLGALIFSRDSLRERLEHPAPGPDGSPGRPALRGALPLITYDGLVTLHVNGENVRLIPIRNAHTDGDTLVMFQRHDILAVGDYYRSVGYPFVDVANGGSLSGILDALGATIGLSGRYTRIIPGHGPIADRNALIASRDLLLALRSKVTSLAVGKTVEEVVAAKPNAEFDAQIPQGTQTSEMFVRWLYMEVTSPYY